VEGDCLGQSKQSQPQLKWIKKKIGSIANNHYDLFFLKCWWYIYGLQSPKNYQQSISDKINSAMMILSDSGIYDLG
jgi:hypothetical protein